MDRLQVPRADQVDALQQAGNVGCHGLQNGFKGRKDVLCVPLVQEFGLVAQGNLLGLVVVIAGERCSMRKMSSESKSSSESRCWSVSYCCCCVMRQSVVLKGLLYPAPPPGACLAAHPAGLSTRASTVVKENGIGILVGLEDIMDGRRRRRGTTTHKAAGHGVSQDIGLEQQHKGKFAHLILRQQLPRS